ncbi:hypothetical protein GFV15_02975 [Lactococcus lactis]|uniref:hypothetical protein n=1 Tax=Lactococcus lactis TaxID=1358 RepID=UPI0012930547|nr:hypothetical protein [Lactococcus lactis]MQQ79944.1 hypothetical protein [Lactococcus lactis]
MRKTYLMSLFNWVQKLMILTGFTILIFIFVKLLAFECEQFKLKLDLSHVEKTLEEIIFGILFLIVLLETIEIIKRIYRDSLSNLMKSVRGTIRFRRFLKQVQKTEDDSVTSNFNRAVRKSSLDVTGKKLILFVKTPHQAQAQKIMKEQEPLIKEHIANFYPNYIISTFERNSKGLWLIGTQNGALASERKAKKHQNL